MLIPFADSFKIPQNWSLFDDITSLNWRNLCFTLADERQIKNFKKPQKNNQKS